MMTNKMLAAAMTCVAILATALDATALDAKRTVIVCGGPSDPVAIRARAELERANISVVSPVAVGDASRTEIETLTRATGASAALIVRPEGVDVWLVDDNTRRAVLIERVEDNDLGALRAVEITRASFAPPVAAAPAPPASAAPAPDAAREQHAVQATDDVSRWSISGSTGPAFLLSQNRTYPNSFIVPIEVGVQRAVGRRVSLGIYGAGAPGVSLMDGRGRSVAQWRAGASVQVRLGSKPGAGPWTSLAAGYTVLELAQPRSGIDVALFGGYEFRIGDRTTIGPFASLRGGVSEGEVHESLVPTLNVTSTFRVTTVGGPTLFASGLAGARVSFDGL